RRNAASQVRRKNGCVVQERLLVFQQQNFPYMDTLVGCGGDAGQRRKKNPAVFHQGPGLAVKFDDGEMTIMMLDFLRWKEQRIALIVCRPFDVGGERTGGNQPVISCFVGSVGELDL